MVLVPCVQGMSDAHLCERPFSFCSSWSSKRPSLSTRSPEANSSPPWLFMANSPAWSIQIRYVCPSGFLCVYRTFSPPYYQRRYKQRHCRDKHPQIRLYRHPQQDSSGGHGFLDPLPNLPLFLLPLAPVQFLPTRDPVPCYALHIPLLLSCVPVDPSIHFPF